MTVRIDELQDMDFSNISEGRLRPVHPGEILREEFLMPMKITPHALCRNALSINIMHEQAQGDFALEKRQNIDTISTICGELHDGESTLQFFSECTTSTFLADR